MLRNEVVEKLYEEIPSMLLQQLPYNFDAVSIRVVMDDTDGNYYWGNSLREVIFKENNWNSSTALVTLYNYANGFNIYTMSNIIEMYETMVENDE